jgi:hypothetical protein
MTQNLIGYSGSDPQGYTSINGEKVTHVIFSEYKHSLVEFINKGFYDNLKSKGFLPEIAEISGLDSENTNLTLTQKKYVIKYPYEMTNMELASMGKQILRLGENLDRLGFGLRDCHPFNFFHDGNNILLLDVGSIIIKRNNRDFIFPILEFNINYKWNISIKNKFPTMGVTLSSMDFHTSIDPQEILTLSRKKIRPGKLLGYIYKLYLVYLKLDLQIHKIVENPRYNNYHAAIYRLIIWARSNYYFRLAHKTYDRNVSRICTKDYWKNYSKEINEVDNYRFDKIISEILDLKQKSILDVGGNSGYIFFRTWDKFDKRLSQKYTVLDSSMGALDAGRREAQRHVSRKGIEFIYYDFVKPRKETFGISIVDRFKSDVVLCLALTHHLILSEGLSINKIVSELHGLTNKYLFVEFMPLGLYSSSAPFSRLEVPHFYTEEWFEDKLKDKFSVLKKISIEKNRVLFICLK